MIPAEWATIDFETLPIGQRSSKLVYDGPAMPPRPVGMASRTPWSKTQYFAVGHPTGNTISPEALRCHLGRIWDSGLPIVGHNIKFDVEVACEWFDLPMLPWERMHDTGFLAYLCDPHARKLDLKSLAEDFLQWPPEERDHMAEWVGDNTAALIAAYPWNREWDKKEQRFKDPRRISPTKVGRWIFACPADIVDPYACGDVNRTDGLFKHLAPVVLENGLWSAYDRERELMPILLANEREGMRVDMARLSYDHALYSSEFGHTEEWLRTELKASGLNFDSDQDVAAILSQRGIVKDEDWVSTAGGELSMSKENLLPSMFTGPNGAAIASALGYRNRLKTCLSMFMGPWLAQAQNNNGHVTTNWNQTRGGDKGGTRTGRPSTDNHNFLNISKSFEGRTDGYVHPEFLGVPSLPLCREYILPDEDSEFLHRDFDGQELRVFAHFEQGQLWRAYQRDATIDPHAVVGAELRRLTGVELERTKIKVLNFQAIYGGGVPAAQKKLNCSYAEAKQYKAFHDKALPGKDILNDEIKKLVRQGAPIHTWGGRLYFPETPGYSKKYKKHMTYEYKLINYLVQGSAADLTKQAIIEWNRVKPQGVRFLVTVYDEINISAHHDVKVRAMAQLKEIMELPRLSVPMLSSPKHGPSWGGAKKCPPEKGCPLCS